MVINSNYVNEINSRQRLSISDNTTSEAAAFFNEGQLIKGKIVRAEEKVTIDFEGHELSFPKESVRTAKEGESHLFKVIKASKEGVVLKDMGAVNAKTAAQSVMFTSVDTGLSALVEDFSEVMGAREEEESGQGIERMSEEDYISLKREGFSIERFKAERLVRALERIKAGRIEMEAGIREQNEALHDKNEAVRKVADKKLHGTGIRRLMAEKLKAADLPVTESNLEELEAAVKLSEAASYMDDNAFAYIIKNGKATVDNIYKAVHCGGVRKNTVSEEVWSQLGAGISGVVSAAGGEVTQEDARWLLENDLPVTRDNLILKKELESLKENISEELVISTAVEQMRTGGEAADADLLAKPDGSRSKEVRQAIRDFNRISGEALKLALSKNEGDVNLIQLREAQNSIEAQEQTKVTSEMTIEEITARLRLEEIRLKLTAEAGQSLYRLGIDIATDGLTRIVEGLREQERQYYGRMSREVGASELPENTDLIQRTADSMNVLRYSPASALSITFTQRATITVNNLSETAARQRQQLLRAGSTYEALWTAPRADLGDSIQKAFANADSLLAGCGMEVSEANRRAVRILGYNNLEINEENINSMKLYDAKVNYLIDGMQPVMTSELIKRGINPLEQTVDELTEMIRTIRQETGYTEEEKYSEYLVRMEAKSEISDAGREAYIGIYRLLYNIQKNDGAAIGAVAASGRELTLSNLLSAIRSGRLHGIDAEVGENVTGERTGYIENSISAQINKAYHVLRAERILENITPDMVSEVIEIPDYTDITIEQLEDRMTDLSKKYEQGVSEADDSELTAAREIRELFSAGAAEQRLLQAFSIDDSAVNIKALMTLFDGESVMTGKRGRSAGVTGVTDTREETDIDGLTIKCEAEDIPGSQAEAEAFRNIYRQRIAENIAKAEQYFRGAPVAAGAVGICEAVSRLRLMGGLAERECYSFELDREDGSSVAVNLTVIHGSSDKGRVCIRIEAEQGEIKAELSTSNREIKGLITCGSRNILQDAEKAAKIFSERLTESGYRVGSMNVAVDGKGAQRYIYRLGEIRQEASTGYITDEKADTGDLYSIAKQFINVYGMEAADEN